MQSKTNETRQREREREKVTEKDTENEKYEKNKQNKTMKKHHEKRNEAPASHYMRHCLVFSWHSERIEMTMLNSELQCQNTLNHA